MFPILYENISVGVVPQHHGLGTLSDAISCIVEEERNGKYQLTLEYPITGIHASDIAYRRILKVKPNYTDPAQLFRIDRIGKTMNGKFTIYAKHISYDISGYDILSGEANNVVSACAMLTQATQLDPEHHPDEKFTIETSKTTTGIFSIKEPSSVRSWFGGKEGSLLDVYGGGEWHYNNFTCKLWEHRGVVEARETIRYTKNLLELSQEIDASNLYTDVICYYKNDSGVMVASEKRSTGLSLDVPKVLLVDVSSDFDTEPSEAMLNDAADAYIGSHNLTVPSNNITLDFVQSGELTGRVDLCDKVNVYYEAFGINAEFKCIRTKWDCLREKYIETEFGDAKQSLADTISQTTSTVDTIAGIAGDKKRVFVNQPVPPYDVGDLWVNDGTIYYCIEGKKETIIKEEEGEVITFDTLQKSNLLECKAGINFTQDLHGYSKPWAAGTGKNMLDVAGRVVNTSTESATNIRAESCTIVKNGDTLICTTTGAWAKARFGIDTANMVNGQEYTASATFDNPNALNVGISYNDGTGWKGTRTSTATTVSLSITFTYDSSWESLIIGFICNNSTDANTGKIVTISKLMLEKSSTATAYEPYSNVCEITGFEEANIARTGKNLVFKVIEHSNLESGGNIANANDYSLAVARVIKGKTYKISSGGGFVGGFFTSEPDINSVSYNSSRIVSNDTTVIAELTGFMVFRTAYGYATPQLEFGSTATSYVAYDGEVFDVDIRINKGVNIWDEDWEAGGINTDTGLPVTDNSKIRSKNFTEVEPSTDYYFVYKDGNMVVIFYDENYNVISYTGRGLKTTPANCRYVKLRMGSMASPVTEYAYNAGINYPATETFYHAHAGDPVYKGELNVTTGELKVTYGFINMGSLGWFASSYAAGGATTEPKYRYIATDLRNIIKKPSANSVPINACCDSYPITDANTPYARPVNDVVCGEVAGEVNVYTSQYATADAVKAGLQGVMLVYELAEPITVNVDANDIKTLLFNNMWTDTNGSIYAKYMYLGFASDDWQLATDFVDETNLEDSIRNATEIITGATGGNVVINYKDVSVDGVITKRPYEILILCDADTIDEATQIWRWNAGGLGYSNTGYDGEYATAISVDLQTGKGYINADFITAGVLDASLVTIRDLTATMFTGNTIVLGGSDNSKLEVQDTSGNPLIRINRNGMECFGTTVNNITPSVVFDKNGVTGYSNSNDKENTAIFWTKKDEFHMKNAVIENEASFGGKIKFVPITVGNFEGIAVVPVI